jgi:murein DD-endopeptidase MepM/ murein hydrolase activator NlpD
LVLFVVSVLVLLNTFNSGFFANALTLNQQKKEIENQKSKINESLNNVSLNLEDAKKLGNTLQEEINLKNSEIAKTEEAIEQVNQLIASLENQINVNQQKRDEAIANIKSLFIELQKQQSPFETLLSSESLSDALSKFYSTNLLQTKANNYRVELEESNKRLEEVKIEQEEARFRLEDTNSLLASQQSYLTDLRVKTQNDEAKYQQLKNSLLEENKIIEQRIQELEARARRLEEEARRRAEEERRRRETSSGGSGNQGGGAPDDFSDGKCFFEERRSLNVPNGFFGIATRGRFERGFANCSHDAVDISNRIGTDIYSIADGTVVAKGSFDVVGYGIYVIVKHVLPSGQRVYSLYAHLNNPSPRSVGENVSKGQVIGSMGCTGNCTGPHLHVMLYSDTYESEGPGCRWGTAKCYDIVKYIKFSS